MSSISAHLIPQTKWCSLGPFMRTGREKLFAIGTRYPFIPVLMRTGPRKSRGAAGSEKFKRTKFGGNGGVVLECLTFFIFIL